MKRIEIQPGETYGKAVILHEIAPRYNKNGNAIRRVRCLCECGREFDTDLVSQRSGNTKSCGCYRDSRADEARAKNAQAKRDKNPVIEGARYGLLTILEEIPSEGGHRCVLCLCDCGEPTTTHFDKLLNGHTKSCGCLHQLTIVANLKQRAIDQCAENPIIIGERFGYLTIIADLSASEPNRMVLCQCDCGELIERSFNAVSKGNTRSCGCLKTALLHLRSDGLKQAYPSEYSSWQAMLNRTRNPNMPHWKDYGGRGIKVHADFQEFATFLAYMGPKPHPSYTIDRKDVNGDYEPGNVRWATPVEQGRNKRNNVHVEVENEHKTYAELAEETGLRRETIRRRHLGGLDITYQGDLRSAMTTRVKKSKHLITIDGTTKPATEWAAESGISAATITRRYKSGYRGDALFWRGDIRGYKTAF